MFIVKAIIWGIYKTHTCNVPTCCLGRTHSWREAAHVKASTNSLTRKFLNTPFPAPTQHLRHDLCSSLIQGDPRNKQLILKRNHYIFCFRKQKYVYDCIFKLCSRKRKWKIYY